MSVAALRRSSDTGTLPLSRNHVPIALAAIAAAGLFAQPFYLLVRDWWTDSEAGHGLLLAPVALWLAWRSGLRADRAPSPWLGTLVLAAAVLLRYLGGLAAELYTLRFSMVLALAGLTIFAWGLGQVRRWWLPFMLVALSIPLPNLVTSALALPLQFKASSMGAALLRWREVPAALAGNVIQLPGRQLFVTEACSGLRSLTALLSLGVLIAGLWLHSLPARALVVGLAIPVAIVVNAVRVFLTGFLVYFVDPRLGEGFMHLTEGWLLFVVAFAGLGALAWGAAALERRWLGERSRA
ncbi:MAG TPA: exosortase/archaeosortase family protein [Gemmatimonadales bacterium]|nr:exosortase/archaeosortase family protein [Gemmatimonadales bacterium]